MQVDEKLISYLEDLSCLSLSGGEKDRLAGDLEKIIGEISRLNKLDTDGIPLCSTPLDTVNVFRIDECRPSFDRELILKNAPVKNDEFFIAPKTVEQS